MTQARKVKDLKKSQLSFIPPASQEIPIANTNQDIKNEDNISELNQQIEETKEQSLNSSRQADSQKQPQITAVTDLMAEEEKEPETNTEQKLVIYNGEEECLEEENKEEVERPIE